MCYWHGTKYRIYENQPITMLGSFGPEIYKGICPDFHVTRYELLNGRFKNEKQKSNMEIIKKSITNLCYECVSQLQNYVILLESLINKLQFRIYFYLDFHYYCENDL